MESYLFREVMDHK